MSGAPADLQTLAGRFDRSVLAPVEDGARARLEVRDGGSYDAVVRGDRLELEAANGIPPDAQLTADAATWTRIASDLRGGMAAFRAGRLRVRHNLHLGVGFLAATCGDTRAGAPALPRARHAAGRISAVEAGTGEPLSASTGSAARRPRSCRRSPRSPASASA